MFGRQNSSAELFGFLAELFCSAEHRKTHVRLNTSLKSSKNSKKLEIEKLERLEK
jgi:hypothetical protein